MPPSNGLKSRVSHAAPGRATSSSSRAQVFALPLPTSASALPKG